MNYRDLLKEKFSHPAHTLYGPKTPKDQLKAFLCAVTHDLEDGLGEARFDDTATELLVTNPDDGNMVVVPLLDLAMLGYVPAKGQSAEDFLTDRFQDW